MRFFGKCPAISPKRERHGDPEGDTYRKTFPDEDSYYNFPSSKATAMNTKRGQKAPSPSIQSSPDRYRDTEDETQYTNDDDDMKDYPLLRVPTAQAYESDDSDLELSRKDSRYDFRRDHLDDLDLEDDRMDRYGQSGTRRRLMGCDSDSSAGAMWTSFDEYDLRQDNRDPLQFDPRDNAWEIVDGEEGGSLLDIRDGPNDGYDIMELARNNIRVAAKEEIRDPPDAEQKEMEKPNDSTRVENAYSQVDNPNSQVDNPNSQVDNPDGLPSYRTRNRTSYRSKDRPSYLDRARREQIREQQLPEDILEDLLDHPKDHHLDLTMPINDAGEYTEEENLEETNGEFQQDINDQMKSVEVEKGHEEDLMPPVQFNLNNSNESKSSLSSFLDGTVDDKKTGSVQGGKHFGRRASRRKQEEVIIKVPPREPEAEAPTPKSRRNSRRPPRRPSSPTQAEVIRKVQELNKTKKQRRKSGVSSPPSVNSDGKKAFGLGFFRKRSTKAPPTQEAFDQQSENESNKQSITESEQPPPISVAEPPNEEVSFLDDEDDINTLNDDPIYMERQDAEQNSMAREEELKLSASTERKSRCRVVPVAEECGLFQAVSGLMGLEDEEKAFRRKRALKDGEITLDSVDTPQEKDEQPARGYCSHDWYNGAGEPNSSPSTAVDDKDAKRKSDAARATTTNDVDGNFEESSVVQDVLKAEMSLEHDSLQRLDKDEPATVVCLRDHYCDPVANCVMYAVQGVDDIGCQPDFEYLDNAIKAEDPADDISPKGAVHAGSFVLDKNRSKRHSRNQSKSRRATVVEFEEEEDELIDLPFKTIEIPAAVSAYDTESVNASSYTNFGGRRNTGGLRVDTSLEEEMKEIEGELAGGKKKSLFRRMRRK